MILEKEIKISLSLDEYNKVDKLFAWTKEYYQVNHYYGNEIDILSHSNTYRVREKNGIIKMQVKIPEKRQGSLRIKKEYEIEIKRVPQKIQKEELTNLTGLYFEEDKYYIGKLLTYRKECLAFKNVEICIDMNEYLNKIDYGLEVEYKNEYPDYIIEFLEENGIKLSEKVEGKSTRYMRELLRQKNMW